MKKHMIKIKRQKGITLIKLIAFIIGLLFLTNIITTLLSDDKNSETVSKADGFTIDSYNVILDVSTTNKVYVTEEVTVNWYDTNHHGIYKFTPQWLEYTGKDGKTIKRKSIISNLRASGENYSIDWVKKKARIKIGSASKYVNRGLKTYTITYSYDMGKDPYKDFDEFIFHAFGDYWGTEIKKASIQINMPYSIKDCDINFFADKYRENNVTDYTDYYVEGNILYAKFDGDKYFTEKGKQLTKSLTVDIELPEGYFKGGSWNYGLKSMALCIIVFGITVYTIITWYKYGKNFPKKEKTVEFYPPEDYSSAEIGYIYGKQPSKKLTISLIIGLAAKGYIKIDEIDKKIQITNLISKKPIYPKSVEEMLPKRVIEIKKLMNLDNNLSNKAKNMMIYLFKKGNTKKLKANIDRFFKVKDELLNGGYIEIISDNEDERLKELENKQKEFDENLKKYNEEIKKYNNETAKLKPLNKLESIVFDRLVEGGDSFVLSDHKTLYKAFSEVESELEVSLKDKIDDKKAKSKRKIAIFNMIISLIFSIAAYSGIEDMDPKWSILYTISFLCITINFWFSFIMGRKTEYGETISAQVEGFRNFLILAEKPKLEELVSEDPKYFYNILPYTYALNISKKWINKFENIPFPEVDMGSFSYSSDINTYRLYSDVYKPTYSPSSGGSGCSSCGGGCSSCGGGCSSCGGGGSW